MYKIAFNKKIGIDFYIMRIEGNFEGSPGQFYMLRAEDSFMTLSRPISIYDIGDNYIEFMYKTVGKGTQYFSKMQRGDSITLYGPYGNGFPVDEYIDKKVALVGGGMGIAPLMYLAKKLNNPDIYLGMRKEAMSPEQMREIGESYSRYGATYFNIGNDMTEKIDLSKYDAVMTCGPEILMKKIKDLNKNTYVSLEKHMGCAVGACLSCTCDVNGKRVRVCKEGPVFRGSEVDFKDED